MSKGRPKIGITVDVTETDGRLKLDVAQAYGDAVTRGGGVPILLVPRAELVEPYLELCDGFVFTGGDDPRTEDFGVPTHNKAKPMHPVRQSFEVELLRRLRGLDSPVLGVCLGMQLMSLTAGGRLNQHMADVLPTHAGHWGAEHEVVPMESARTDGRFRFMGTVQSKHKQSVEDAGVLTAIASSRDGVIEAVFDPAKRFHVGVQWHPERTREDAVGQRLFDELIAAARG
ncbi:MAG: gamma-glutamyl-gamma-aminobutyrate hydrolase family protein [Phycisphaerae bacterium]|nr:gamma-glutamyl-gamma-aminobutyrate hydrolase family protein [Phycisphaerae bacterium]